MEQLEQQHVQMPVKEERNIVQQELQVVVQYQLDTIQQDVIVQEINVLVNHNVLNQLVRLLEHIVQMV